MFQLLVLLIRAGPAVGDFVMTSLTTLPNSSTVIREGTDLQIDGQSSEPWDLCQLSFGDVLLCRQGALSSGCTFPKNVTRPGGITTENVANEATLCRFHVKQLRSEETGFWKMTLLKWDKTMNEQDARFVFITVSTEANISLAYSDDSTSKEVVLGVQVNLTCSGSGGRPEVDSLEWELTDSNGMTVDLDEWGVVYEEYTYSKPDQYSKQRNISQSVSIAPNMTGSFQMHCSASQVGYTLNASTVDLVVVSREDDGSDPTKTSGGLTTLDIVFIVLGCLFFIIILVVVLVAFITKTFCFRRKKPKDEEINQRSTVTIGYHVGQDYMGNDSENQAEYKHPPVSTVSAPRARQHSYSSSSSATPIPAAKTRNRPGARTSRPEQVDYRQEPAHRRQRPPDSRQPLEDALVDPYWSRRQIGQPASQVGSLV